MCGLSLVVSGDCSWLQCEGFSLWWLLLLWSRGSRHTGFSRCNMQAQQQWFAGSRVQDQQLWYTGLVALRHVESSRPRDRTCVSCIGRYILIHCTTREVSSLVSSTQDSSVFCQYSWNCGKLTRQFTGRVKSQTLRSSVLDNRSLTLIIKGCNLSSLGFQFVYTHTQSDRHTHRDRQRHRGREKKRRMRRRRRRRKRGEKERKEERREGRGGRVRLRKTERGREMLFCIQLQAAARKAQLSLVGNDDEQGPVGLLRTKILCVPHFFDRKQPSFSLCDLP